MKECGWRGSPDSTAASNAANAAAVSPLAHATSISRLAACPGLGAKFCGMADDGAMGARQGRRAGRTIGAMGREGAAGGGGGGGGERSPAGRESRRTGSSDASEGGVQRTFLRFRSLLPPPQSLLCRFCPTSAMARGVRRLPRRP